MQKEKEVRAFYTDQFIRVYQAFNDAIADSALQSGKFVSPPFKIERTTWIKPSFLWMMYRSGWATKENQNRILAIDITHQGFLWAVEHSCLSHFDSSIHAGYEEWEKLKNTSPVVIQWDPERDIHLNKLEYRAIQIGLTPPAAKLYTEQWITDISDVTATAQKIESLIENNLLAEAMRLLPIEKIYSPLDPFKQTLGK
jgi:hypothetical protein